MMPLRRNPPDPGAPLALAHLEPVVQLAVVAHVLVGASDLVLDDDLAARWFVADVVESEPLPEQRHAQRAKMDHTNAPAHLCLW